MHDNKSLEGNAPLCNSLEFKRRYSPPNVQKEAAPKIFIHKFFLSLL